MLDYLMQQLSKELEITPPLKPIKRGVYELTLDTLNITIAEMPLQGVSLSSSLGPFPLDREEAFFQELLRANLFGEATHGATLGLSHDASTITLTREATQQLDYEEFKSIVENFINAADFWREEAQEPVK